MKNIDTGQIPLDKLDALRFRDLQGTDQAEVGLSCESSLGMKSLKSIIIDPVSPTKYIECKRQAATPGFV